MNEEPRRIDFLDHLRGVAIALVFGFHALGESFGTYVPQWGRWFLDIQAGRSFLVLFPFTYGWMGVTIFFVISGFCIHLSYERDQPKDFRKFFIRRFFRIYPPYCVAIILFSFIITPYQVATTSRDLTTHVLLIHNLDVVSPFSINPSFWTIALEVQLYALYPFLVLVARRYGWGTALWLTGAVTLSIRTYSFLDFAFDGTLPPLPSWLLRSPFMYWFSWTLGAKLAQDFLHRRPSSFSRVPIWVWPVLTAMSGILKPLGGFGWEFAALATERVMAHLIASPPSQSFLAQPLIRYVGVVGVSSYSMYLLHEPVLSWLRRQALPASLTGDIHPFLIFLFCIGAWIPIFSLARLSYRFLEIPSISLGKQLLKQWKIGHSVRSDPK